MAKIEVLIDHKTGKHTVHVEGVAGPACEEHIRRIVALLGEPTTEERTDEYYQVESQQQTVGGY